MENCDLAVYIVKSSLGILLKDLNHNSEYMIMSWKNNAGNYISQQQIICMLQVKEKLCDWEYWKRKG